MPGLNLALDQNARIWPWPYLLVFVCEAAECDICPYVFDWNESNQNTDSSYNDDMKEKRDRWIKTLEKDIYVNEAMNLLKDLSSIEGGQILSQLNKD